MFRGQEFRANKAVTPLREASGGVAVHGRTLPRSFCRSLSDFHGFRAHAPCHVPVTLGVWKARRALEALASAALAATLRCSRSQAHK